MRANELALTNAAWTAIENDVIADMRWWSEAELLSATDTVWPENLGGMLALAR